MAKESGGGGHALGWTLLGFLAGVAATLGVQILMSGNARQAASQQEAVSVAPVVASAPIEPITPPKAAPVLSAPPPAPTPVAAASHDQPLSPQVADDAAAAGMTSRTTPATGADNANN